MNAAAGKNADTKNAAVVACPCGSAVMSVLHMCVLTLLLLLLTSFLLQFFPGCAVLARLCHCHCFRRRDGGLSLPQLYNSYL